MTRLMAAPSLLDEWTRQTATDRTPEPEVMDEREQVEAYAAAGADLDLITGPNLFHTAQALELILPGDRVLDLGCGPGYPLLHIARLRPEAGFLGVDLSPRMLERAERSRADRGVSNVTFDRADITDLNDVADSSIDVVISCMTLHHLPDADHLCRCFAAIARVLRPGGRVYLADFRRPRSPRAARWVARRRESRQPEVFSRDFENSLRAAFSCRELADATEGRLPGHWRCMRFLPLMTALQSPAAHQLDAHARAELSRLRRELPGWARRDLNMIRFGFRLGGVPPAI